MRRIELISATENVISVLETTKIERALRLVMESLAGRPMEGVDVWTMVLQSVRDYAVATSVWGEAERKVIKLLKLEELGDASTWQLTDKSESRSKREKINTMWRTILFAMANLPSFIDLIRQSGSDDAGDKDMLLRVVLVEENERASTPERMVRVLQGVQELYEVCATLEDTPIHTISVVACDSGSDKSFDFFGVAKVIQCLKELIVSMWDRVVFYREHKLEARLSAVSKALPVLEKINTMKSDGAMDPAQAEQLRRKVIDGATKLLEGGILTPEIYAQATYNPRQLMVPELKLLTAGSATRGGDDQSQREGTFPSTPLVGASPKPRTSAGGVDYASAEQVSKNELTGRHPVADASNIEADVDADPGEASDLSMLTPDELVSLKRLLEKTKGGQGITVTDHERAAPIIEAQAKRAPKRRPK